ncbi:hypothetical protein MMC26_003642 [Xylographa opegraphella]|nr:hypothetical protein [Xylographa opegraphella]
MRRPTQASSYHNSILDIPLPEAKAMLKAHIIDKNTCMSEFGSWSSSLLFILLDATRKTEYQHEAIVCVYVLNTRKLTKASVFPAATLLRAYEIPSEGELPHGKYSDEYLVHGAIDNEGCFSVAGLQQLREGGLYDRFPELGVDQGKKALSQRVEELRSKYFAHVWLITMSGVRSLRDLAMCFGPEWVLPLTMTFLCLRLRHHKGRRYPQALLQELGDLKFPAGYVFGDHLFGTFYCDAREVPEVAQFTSLLRRLCEAKYRDLLVRNGSDVYVELSDLIADPSGFRSSDLLSRDVDPGSTLNTGAVDEDSSSEEEGSGYEEEED